MNGHILHHCCRRASLMAAGAAVGALCTLFPDAGVRAQQVIVPSGDSPESSPPAPAAQADWGGPETGTPSLGDILSSWNPFQYGPVTLHPRVSYQFTYSDKVQVQPGVQRKTVIQRIAPGMNFEIGRHWNLDYAPTISLYSDSGFKNNVSHSIRLSGATTYNDWRLGLSQSCAILSEPQAETGAQTDQRTYVTSLNAGYPVNSETSLELSVRQHIRTVSGFANASGVSRNWSTMDWLNYQWAPSLGAAAGVGFGYEMVDGGSDMTYEQLRGRFTWRVVQKITLSINGGAEIRQLLDSTESDLINPVFGAAITYHPFELTTLSLNGDRSVQSSFFRNQITEVTRVDLAIRQRVFERFHLTLSGGFANTSYENAAPGGSGTREDDYGFVKVNLSTGFPKRGRASVFYSISRNSSNAGGFGYTSEQYGFQLAYSY